MVKLIILNVFYKLDFFCLMSNYFDSIKKEKTNEYTDYKTPLVILLVKHANFS